MLPRPGRIRGDGVTALDFFDGLIDEVRVLEKVGTQAISLLLPATL
jgi:hypothetical protein